MRRRNTIVYKDVYCEVQNDTLTVYEDEDERDEICSIRFIDVDQITHNKSEGFFDLLLNDGDDERFYTENDNDLSNWLIAMQGGRSYAKTYQDKKKRKSYYSRDADLSIPLEIDSDIEEEEGMNIDSPHPPLFDSINNYGDSLLPIAYDDFYRLIDSDSDGMEYDLSWDGDDSEDENDKEMNEINNIIYDLQSREISLDDTESFGTDYFGVCASRNVPSHMEDTFVCEPNLTQRLKDYQEERNVHKELPSRVAEWSSYANQPTQRFTALFAIFDGHGGKGCSTFCREHLVETFAEVYDNQKGNLNGKTIMKSLFSSLEQKVEQMCLQQGCLDGTTATICLIDNNFLFIGNVGDSEGYLYNDGKAIELTEIHNMDNRGERDRIERAGGWIRICKDSRNSRKGSLSGSSSLSSSSYTSIDKGYINGCLLVSRSLGDIGNKMIGYQYNNNLAWPNSMREREGIEGFKGDVISSVPYIKKEKKECDCILLASDGLWDVIDPGFCLKLAKKLFSIYNNPEMVCLRLVYYVTHILHSDDNVTVIFITIPGLKRNKSMIFPY
ncbi:hypothetical protein WA158_003246 [Blastocystis sp. Blastoise]